MHHDENTQDHDHNHESETPSSSKRDPCYWQSLEEWGGDPEFQKMAETEFMSSPLREGLEKEGQDGFARREFLKLMGASLAMATAGCI
ncbi:TAT-variant-translocated molybdopterin oxidoreductase, partial [Acetobacter lovaniensis]|uniref:TAT-variant-translocated molybdopterin oxidoreductase n=1 Tax=Acetobacter lovaniensis TaxID=104100 RepID=UPI0037703D9B